MPQANVLYDGIVLPLATFPDSYRLVHTTSHHEGSSFVKVWKKESVSTVERVVAMDDTVQTKEGLTLNIKNNSSNTIAYLNKL